MIGMNLTGRLRRRGFTLVEMLIVVGILVVLLSILMPTMARVRDQARRTHCLNNLRSLALAGIAYASDDDEGYFILPLRTDAGDNFTLWYPKYVSDLRVFVCPSTANAVRFASDLKSNAHKGAQDSSGGHSYELRNWYWTNTVFPDGVSFVDHSATGDRVPKRLKGGHDVKSSRIMLVTDADDDAGGDQNNWPDKLPNGTSDDNHGAEGMNASFIDGRAEWLPTGRPVLQAYMDGYYDPGIPAHIINKHGLYKDGNTYRWGVPKP